MLKRTEFNQNLLNIIVRDDREEDKIFELKKKEDL